MSDLQIIIEEKAGKKITIDGKEFFIKNKLSIKQESRLLPIVGSVFATGVKLFQNFSGKTNNEDIGQIIKAFTGDELVKILAISLNTDDIEFCENIDGDIALDLITETIKTKINWENVKKNLQSLGELPVFQKQEPPTVLN